MRPDLSDNEHLLSPDTEGKAEAGGEGDSGQGRVNPPHMDWPGASGLVDFFHIYSGLARQVGD